MKLLIAGSRGIENFDLSKYIEKDIDTILSGGAKGIDTLAEEYADKMRLSKIILRPRYDLYGKAAPIKRNEELVNRKPHRLMYVGFIVDNKRDTRNGCLRNVLCMQVISLRTAVHDEQLSNRTSFFPSYVSHVSRILQP